MRKEKTVIKALTVTIGLLFSSSLKALEKPQRLSPFKEEILKNFSALNLHFVGREREQFLLKNFFSNSSGRVYIIMGFPGIGKSALARQFVLEEHSNYDFILWLNGAKDLNQQLLEFSCRWNASFSRLKIPDIYLDIRSASKVLKDWVMAHPGRWLIILDGLDEEKKVQEYILDLDLKAGKDIMITTTKETVGEVNKMSLTKLPRKDSIDLLKKYIGEEKSLEELAQVLGDFPLALKHGAIVLKCSPALTIPNFIKIFKEKKEILNSLEILVTSSQEVSDYKTTVSSLVELTLKELKEKSPLSFEVLQALTFIDTKNISLKLIESFLKENGLPHEKAHEVIFHLSSRFILERKRPQENNINYEIHNFLSRVINEQISLKKRKLYISKWINIFNKEFNQEIAYLQNFTNKDRALYENGKVLLSFVQEMKLQGSKIVEFKIHIFYIGLFLFLDFDYTDALIPSLKEEVKSYKNLDLFVKARFYGAYGNSIVTENVNKAIFLSEKALTLLNLLQDKKSKAETFFIMVANIIDFNLLIGNISESFSFCKQAEAFLPFFEDPYYENFLKGIRFFVLMERGDFKVVLETIDKSIDKAGLDHTSILLKAIKIECLTEVGQYEASLYLGKKFLSHLEKIYPSLDTYLPLRIRAIISYNYLHLKDYVKALSEIERVIEGCRKLAGSDTKYPTQATSYMILGDIYKALNQPDKALQAYQFAELIFDKIYIKKELFRISSLYKKIVLYALELKDESMMQEYFHKLIIYFGQDHINTRELIYYFDEHDLPLP